LVKFLNPFLVVPVLKEVMLLFKKKRRFNAVLCLSLLFLISMELYDKYYIVISNIIQFILIKTNNSKF